MRKLTLVFIVTCWTQITFGQYPFEHYTQVKYKQAKSWIVDNKCKTEGKVFYTINIPDFYANHDKLSLQLTSLTDNFDTSYIQIKRNKKQIQKFTEPFGVGNSFECNTIEPTSQSIYVEDVNGDGLKDLKILIPGNGCCGAYNFYLQVIYFFQKKDGTFTNISFSDLMMNYEHRPERDIDGDGNYEIITQTFQHAGEHNYWVFNLYNFNGKELINVNNKADYPIMIQLLNKNNYVITTKLTKSQMKKYFKKLPDGYDKR